MNVSKIHFIGHSLGAHFAGFVGSWLIDHAGVKMARISGTTANECYSIVKMIVQLWKPEHCRTGSGSALLPELPS